MKEDSLKQGAFGWTELMTSDPEGAVQFYRALFGWETEEYPMEDMKYTVLKVDGEMVGGIMQTTPEAEEMPPSWGVYVTVKDVDAVAAEVEKLGGKLLRPPMDIPETGRFCVIQDPQGGTICAITYVKEA